MSKNIKYAAILLIVSVGIVFRAYGDIRSNTNICIIYAVDSDESKFGKFPWLRSVHADLIENLEQSGAKLIVLKYILDTPSSNLSSDKRLTDVCRKYHNVIIPFSGNLGISSDTVSANVLRNYSVKNEIKQTKLLSFDKCAFPFEDLLISCAGTGSMDISPEQVNNIERLPLVVKVQENVYPSLPLIVVAKLFNYSCKDILVKDNKVIMGKSIIHMDSKGMFIPKLSKSGDKFKRYNYTDILNNKYKIEDIKGAIVIIGYNGTRFNVNHITKASRNHNGADINADAISTLLFEIKK